MNGESLRNTVGIGGGGGSAIEPSFHDIHCSCGVDVCIYVYEDGNSFWLRCDGGQQCGSSNDAQLEQYLLHLRPHFSRLRVCVLATSLLV